MDKIMVELNRLVKKYSYDELNELIAEINYHFEKKWQEDLANEILNDTPTNKGKD